MAPNRPTIRQSHSGTGNGKTLTWDGGYIEGTIPFYYSSGSTGNVLNLWIGTTNGTTYLMQANTASTFQCQVWRGDLRRINGGSGSFKNGTGTSTITLTQMNATFSTV